MRTLKLLLSAGTMLGTVRAGRRMPAASWTWTGNPSTPTGVGMATLPDGFAAVGSPYTGAQGLEGEAAVPFSVPAPGNINMRINL